MAWRQILADEGPVVAVFRSLGLVSQTGGLYPSALAVITGLVYNFLPFMTLPIYASLERVDSRLVEAAGDLYAKPFTGFRKVTLPLSMPGVVAGTLLTFIPAAGDYVNAALPDRSMAAVVSLVIPVRTSTWAHPVPRLPRMGCSLPTSPSSRLPSPPLTTPRWQWTTPSPPPRSCPSLPAMS